MKESSPITLTEFYPVNVLWMLQSELHPSAGICCFSVCGFVVQWSTALLMLTAAVWIAQKLQMFELNHLPLSHLRVERIFPLKL
jgi:hypothetical protein